MSVSYHMSESYKSTVLNRSQSAGNWAEADRPLVILVDDDASLREALQELMHSVGLDTISFASTRELARGRTPGSARLPRRRCADAGPKRSWISNIGWPKAATPNRSSFSRPMATSRCRCKR